MRKYGMPAVALGAALVVMGVSAAVAADMNPRPDKPIPLPPASDWATYNGPYSGQRYAELNEINEQSVGDLKEVCRVHVGESGPFQAGPVIRDNTMYLTTPHATLALNPSNCDILWKSIYTPQGPEPWTANRGVAYWQGKVIRGTSDARLVAYDAATGRELWQTIVGDGGLGELIDSAPVAWNGLVFAGLSGGDFGIKGRMFAFSVATGRPVWQFNLIPQAGEPGNESWPGGTSERGGGGTWTSYALDPESAEIFVPVANPAPSFNRSSRPGANLYSDSLVVLDAYTGKLKWYYQVRPNDDHDYGVTSPPMLFTLRDGRKAVALGSKDGHVYVIDRARHTLIYKTPVVPLKNFLVQPTAEGIEICPGVLGGIEWNGPALDRSNNALIVGADDWCSRLKAEPQEYTPGTLFTQGRAAMLGEPKGVITSLDAASGKVRWAFHAPNGVVSAITPTAGGLVFAGDLSGNLYALHSASGEVAKKIETGGALAGGIITYTVSERQYLAVTSGNVSRATFGEAGVPTLIVYGLGTQRPAGGGSTAPASVSAGGTSYGQLCASCHGPHGEGGLAARLQGIGARLDDAAVAALIKKPPNARMPALYPSPLGDTDVLSVAAFVRTLK